MRRRWFLLGSSPGATPLHCTTYRVKSGTWNKTKGYTFHKSTRSWEANIPRMIFRDTPADRERVTMLGNICVPAQAEYAFRTLMRGLHMPLRGTFDFKQGKKIPTWGKKAVGDTNILPMARLSPPCPAPRNARLVLVPRDPISSTQKHLAPHIQHPISLKRWATPRASMGYASSGHATGIARNLTERSRRDVQTQIRFEQHTVDGMQGRLVNPNYLEWMMGCPASFTQFT